MPDMWWRPFYLVFSICTVAGFDAYVVRQQGDLPIQHLNPFAIPYLLGMTLGVLAFRRENWRVPLGLLMFLYLIFDVTAGPAVQMFWKLHLVEAPFVSDTNVLLAHLGRIDTPAASIAITCLIVASYLLSALILWRKPSRQTSAT
jgi:hypothetical protein